MLTLSSTSALERPEGTLGLTVPVISLSDNRTALAGSSAIFRVTVGDLLPSGIANPGAGPH